MFFFFAPSNLDIKWKADGLADAHRLVLRLWDLFDVLAPKVRHISVWELDFVVDFTEID
jgi:hypothetical protein